MTIDDDIELRQYLVILLRHWWWLLIGMLLGLAAGVVFTWAWPSYRVTSLLTASSTNAVIATLATSDAVLNATIETLGPTLPSALATPLEFRKMLAVSQPANSPNVQLAVSDSDEARAAAIAQAWNAALIQAVLQASGETPEGVLQAQLKAQVDQLSRTIELLYDADAVAEDIGATRERLSTKVANSPAAPEDQAILTELSLRATVGEPNVQIMLDQLPAQSVAEQVAYLDGLLGALEARQQALQARRANLETEILGTQTKLAQTKPLISAPTSLQVARIEFEEPPLVRNAVLGLAAGLGLAILLAFAREWWSVEARSLGQPQPAK